MQGATATSRARRLGRYVLLDEIASGGMATVHLGRLLGSVGFARTVAIKRLHPTFAKEPDFVSMFTDEARLAARIKHPNVAATLDVVSEDDELFLVMEYIHGDTLARVLRTLGKSGERVPVAIAVAIVVGVLHGLHAAHEATSERGEPLGVVHRDVSPQNVMIGTDGVARVLDFGVAKAVGRLQTTREGEMKGKTAYMAPEQVRGRGVDRRVDVYAASVVLWETLTGHRLFVGDSAAEVIAQVMEAHVEPPSHYAPGVPPEIDAIVLRGLARDPARRFGDALEMAVALERTVLLPTAREIGAWVAHIAASTLDTRATRVRAIEQMNLDAADASTAAPVSAPRVVAEDVTETVRDDVPSQVSSVSMATPIRLRTESAPTGRRWRRAIAVVAIGSGLVLGVALQRANRSFLSTASAPPPASVATPPPEPQPINVQSAPNASAAPASSDAVVATAEPPPVASSKPAPVTKTPAHRTVRTPAAAPSPRTSKPRAPNCDPPYNVDPDGIHIPKPECG